MWIMLIGLLFFTATRQHFRFSVNGCIKCWWLFTIWSIVGVIYTNDVPYAIGYVLKLIVLVITLSYYPHVDNTDKVTKLLRIIVFIWISTIILEMFFPTQIRSLRLAITTSTESRLQNIDRAIALLGTKYGIFSDPAVGAFFCACGIGIGIGYLVRKKNLIGWSWIVFSAIGIVLTNKRGPMLSIALSASIVYLLRSSVQISKKIQRVLLVVLGIIIILYLFENNTMLANWLARVNSNQHSNNNRMALYTSLYNNFLRHPILGSGTKSTIRLLNGTDGHNIYLASLSENGFIGLLLLLISFFYGLKDTTIIMKAFDHESNKDISSIITFCLFMQLYIVFYGITGNPMTTIYSLAMYFMCLGIPLREYRLLENV